MKKRIVLTSFTALALSAGSFAFALSLNGTNKVEEVESYDSASLPTTIYLDDCTANEIKSYYSSLSSLASSQRQGTNLLKNLKTILKNNQKYLSYDDGSKIWQIYEISDRDWEKSPASSTTYGTYNAQNNTITGYTYGSNSNGKNNPYLHALYVNRNVDNQVTAWGNHNQNQWGINREHVWPKAEGFDDDSLDTSGGARGDPMHLMAGNGYVNQIHSNYYYGYVDTSKTYTDCGNNNNWTNLSNNLRGTSKTVGGSTKVFEPQKSDRGDIARAIFYMVARYNYLSGSDSDGIDSNNPNLTLTQSLNDWSQQGYTSTTSNTGKMGIMTDLLNWHHEDPVDEFEIHRNNLLYRNYTNNRNPFIDYPEWADYIWGTVTYQGTTYKSYSSTPTGYVDLNSDVINGYKGGSSDPVAVTGVQLDVTSKTLKTNQELQLNATVSPSNASDQSVLWTSSDDNVATVHNGLVRTINEGSATITATTTDGGFSATCEITVTGTSSGTIETEDGTVSASSGSFEGWTGVSLGSYSDGSAKFDEGGDNVYKLDIFSGDVSEHMTDLEVTLNAKIYGTPTDANSYKVEAVSGSSLNNLQVIKSLQKTGSSVFTTSYSDVTFSLSEDLEGTTGIRITYVTKGGGNFALSSISWTATYEAPPVVIDPTSGTATFDSTAQGYSDATGMGTVSFDNEEFTATFDKAAGSTSPKYYTTGSAIRCYGGNTINVFSSKQNIYSIVFTFGSGGNSNDIIPSTGTLTNETWSAGSNTYVNSVDFTIDGSKGHRRIAAITVNYYNATMYATDFLSTVVCDGTGNNAPSTSNWSTMSTRAGYLFDQDKDALRTANLVENGTVIEQAMYRYNYIISKYGAATYNNFLTRTISSSNVNFSLFNEDTNMVFVIVLVSVISAASIGCLLLIKKKKTSK